jgi:dienelactone hydrolase
MGFKRTFINIIAFNILICFIFLDAPAQKPVIEKNMSSIWSEVEFVGINNNGSFLAYKVSNKLSENLILQSTITNQKTVIKGLTNCSLTQDNKSAIFSRDDTIYIMDLRDTNVVQSIPDISTYMVSNYGEHSNFLLYKLKSEPEKLIVRELPNGKEQSYQSVKNYWIHDGGNALLFETIKTEANDTIYELNWLNLSSGSSQKIWGGANISELLINDDNTECVFRVPKTNENSINTIWAYRNGAVTARKVLDDHSSGIQKGLVISGIQSFTGDEGRIYLQLSEAKKESVAKKQGIPSVDVWSYKDAWLQSEQLDDLIRSSRGRAKSYQAVANVNDDRVIRLEYENEEFLSRPNLYGKMKYALIRKFGIGSDHWNKDSHSSVYLISLTDGSRRLINKGIIDEVCGSYILSYNQDYVYYYDPRSRNYFTYRIADSSRKNVTSSTKGKWSRIEKSDEPDSSSCIYDIAGLLKNTDDLLIYDQNDIFKLDPNGKKTISRLTEARNLGGDLVFRLMPENMSLFGTQKNFLLSIFDRTEKKQAFLCISFDSLKYMKNLHLEWSTMKNNIEMKARDTSLYIVMQMAAEQSPNLFSTSDLKHFKRLSEVFPEREYNWLTSELVTWKTPDGNNDQGILYKPEDFNPRKKYPMLIYYYERFSDKLHDFIKPELSYGTVNIPFFVSHGYLVFVPDIHYKVGWTGKCAYDAIVSGAQYLSKRSYVDITRMGLQGMSFGGFETNYVVTRTHLFAAAMSSSGFSDFISCYGSIIGGGASRQATFELARERIGATLWQRPDLYIENSPVLLADKVSTPLLMMTNMADDDVPPQQGIELFTALRRLGKKVWMLQYDGEGHGLDGLQAQEDLTDRMYQFFNYYLKGAPPPKWMTKGIPAELKGIDTGLELDTSGANP